MKIINPKEFLKSKTNLAGDLLRNSKTSEKENFAFIIESKELSDFMKKIFNFFWQLSIK